MKLTYQVFSVDETELTRTVDMDGAKVEAKVAGLSVQLVSDYGSIAFAVPATLAKGHPFVAGKEIVVTFGGAK